MDSDGGLHEARARLQREASESERDRRADDEAIDEALKKQATQLDAAINTFDSEIEQLGIPPEKRIAGEQTVGPAARARFRRHPRDGWSFHSEPAPTELLYKFGFTLYSWQTPNGDSSVGQSVFLRQQERAQPKRVQFFNSSGYHSMYPDIPGGILPFHVRDDGNLIEGSTCGGGRMRQLASISRTSEWLVAQLAAYLERRGPDGA